MLLIYDGDCGFCTQTAKWFAARAADGTEIAAWQSLELNDYGLTADQTAASLYWHDGTKLHSGADAVAAALRSLPGPWRFAGRTLALPGAIQLARVIYPVIARYRHRLPGASAACRTDLS